jgi:predicted lipoprotein with Yx(FWY)xxD motif
MHPPRTRIFARRFGAGIPILTVIIAASTACSAFANQAASSSSTADETASTVASPRTDATGTPNPIPSTDQIPPTGDVSLKTDDRGDVGMIIVDSSGRTVYAFTADPLNEPTCYDICADTWLPLLAEGNPAGGIGIDASAAGTAPRRDGGNQVTYKGHPLYHYAGDKGDKDVGGQGLDLFGGEWHVLTKDGQPLA